MMVVLCCMWGGAYVGAGRAHNHPHNLDKAHWLRCADRVSGCGQGIKPEVLVLCCLFGGVPTLGQGGRTITRIISIGFVALTE